MKRKTSLRRLLVGCAASTALGSTALFAAEPSASDALKPGAPWNAAQSDRWVAVDGLGRSLPTFDEVGPTRPDKFVAAFYFLWNGRHGDAGPYDISKILAEHPEAKDDPNSPLWGKMYVPHHWGESIFGYYVGEDEGVLRKHAQMLGDAGVDVICFDVTNQLTYPESYRALFKVFSEMQKAGNKVPKVAFLCPFWAPDKVVRELWRDVYSQDFYSDVWFNWKGKPLILADPDFLGGPNLNPNGCQPVRLVPNGKLTQRFAADRPFVAVQFCLPTWSDANSTVDFVLRDKNGAVLQKRDAISLADNAVNAVRFDALPAGEYEIELSNPQGGRVGWWSTPLEGDFDAAKYPELAGKARSNDGVRWLEARRDGKPENAVRLLAVVPADDERDQILNFFTFRAPQPDYFVGQTKPNQWSWLEEYPQHEFRNDKGEIEQMSVGVAQNAVDGKLGVLSNPTAYGRSYHNGKEPAPEACDFTGRNFQEQWERALKVDPEMIFITGWNEWIAGRFDVNAPFHGATPVSFVDQYNQEFSRDIEPMKGGHGDAFYYQMISNIRRFKGVSKQESTVAASIKVDGKFDDWANAGPRYFDTVDDETRRDERGWGAGTRYVNKTGRNDFVEARVAFDDANLYFYVETREPFVGGPDAENWARLLLDVDENPATGSNGNDFVVVSAPNGKSLVLAKTNGDGVDASAKTTSVEYSVQGNKLEMAIPRAALGFGENVAPFRFKWADAIDVFGEWSGFTTDGDAAPNDRYYYRCVPKN